MASQRSPLGPVQQALFNWLSGDATLAALATIYDQVPQSTPYPYIEIDNLNATKDDTLGDQGRKVIAHVFAFSQAFGFKELEAILQEIMRLLDEDAIPNTAAGMNPSYGWTIWQNMVIMEEVVRLDPITRQLTVQVEVDVSKIALGE